MIYIDYINILIYNRALYKYLKISQLIRMKTNFNLGSSEVRFAEKSAR